MMNALPLIQAETTTLFVVDVQDRLLAAIHEADACVGACRKMIEAATVLEMPIVVTEQYPQGLGPTTAALKEVLADVTVITKTRFSGMVEDVVEQLRRHDRQHILVVGIEAHVCVLQTVLDLLRLGYTPYVCVDAIGSRRLADRDVAIERMRQAGAIITTTESITLEILGEAGTDLFKQILPIIK